MIIMIILVSNRVTVPPWSPSCLSWRVVGGGHQSWSHCDGDHRDGDDRDDDDCGDDDRDDDDCDNDD